MIVKSKKTIIPLWLAGWLAGWLSSCYLAIGFGCLFVPWKS